MTGLEPVLQDQLLRLLDGAPRGMTVERLRSLLQAAGSRAQKDDIARALRALSQRNLVQIGAARRWHIRRSVRPVEGAAPSGAGADAWLNAIPCSAFVGEPSEPGEEIAPGRISPDINLLKRLLPYYQEALRAGDGGSPFEVFSRHGESFICLQPDAPWWPTEGHGRILRIPLSRLPGGFQSALATNVGKRLFRGYPQSGNTRCRERV